MSAIYWERVFELHGEQHDWLLYLDVERNGLLITYLSPVMISFSKKSKGPILMRMPISQWVIGRLHTMVIYETEVSEVLEGYVMLFLG